MGRTLRLLLIVATVRVEWFRTLLSFSRRTLHRSLATLSESGVFEAWAPNVQVALQEQQQAMQSEGPSPTDPSALAQITVPILYLHGSRTPTTWYTEAARYLSEHVADLHVVEIAGTGHFGPHLTPEPVADELVRFFEERLVGV